MTEVENYEDGSWCEFYTDGSGACYTADGYLAKSWEAAPVNNQPSNTVPILDSIGRWISNVTGNYQAQPYPYGQGANRYPTSPGQIPQGRCDGIQIGGSVNALGGGSSGGFCLTKTMLIIGGIAGAFFFFGQRRGRR